MGTMITVGFSSGYNWAQLKPWVESLKDTGYPDEIHIVGTNMNRATIDTLTQAGVKLKLFGQVNEFGDVTAAHQGAPHVERFFYLWRHLYDLQGQFDAVLTTDVRDVIFQNDPKQHLMEYIKEWKLVGCSESLQYKSEPWGNKNLMETFGPFFHDALEDSVILNVGVISGQYKWVLGLLLNIFQMSINRPISIVDQAVYNFIMANEPFLSNTKVTGLRSQYAVQLGTTYEAVIAGSGDLGQQCRNDPEALEGYMGMFLDPQPEYKDGKVYNSGGQEICIVHQWDRVPQLKQAIELKYGETNGSTGPTSQPRLVLY
jgi:hypothetical protein